MAFLIPENLASRSDVPGRIREVAGALRDSLPEDATVWLENLSLEAQLNLPLGGEDEKDSQEPFLAVALPGCGLLLIHVLEGGRRALARARKKRLGEDPLNRALAKLREYSRPGLRRLSESSRWAGVNIPVKVAFAASQVSRVSTETVRFPEGAVLFSEDFMRLGEAVSKLFEEHPERPGASAAPKQAEMERKVISAALHPEVLIRGNDKPPEQGRLALRQALGEDDKKIIKALDREQEVLARWLGDGYRVIKGVAGSGKTLILLSRAKLIGQSLPRWKILLTCYNRVLADELAKQVEYVNVTVKNIDRIPFDLERHLRGRSSKKLRITKGDDFDERISVCVEHLKRHPEAGMFDLVLVDEAQDFDRLRLEFAYRLLKPGREDFIVARDAAQNVYRCPEWIPPGTSGRGRTKILSTNYRNTREVLYPAFNFLMMGESDNKDRSGDPEATDIIIEPDVALRQGPVPRILNVGRDDEVREVCNILNELGEEGVRWDEIAVLCGNYEIQNKYEYQMKRRGIPCLNLAKKEHRDKAAKTSDHVLIASLRLLKGLEFPYVFLSGLEEITVHEKEDDDTTRRRCLYVAMTRSTLYLTIIASGESPYLSDIQEIVKEIRTPRSG